MEKILVILPTYNEKDNIRKIISEILKEGNNVEVLVIDDNSPDGTGDIVSDIIKNNSRVHLLTRPGKLGLGTAYVEGFKYALSHDYELIFEMDADFSHDPKEIPRFLEEIKDSDVVVGSRYISGVNVVNWPMSRLLLSWLANLYTRIVTGMPLKDATSGFKCIKRKVLEDINLEHIQSDGYSFQIEIHYRVWRKGFKIKEIPIIFIDRRIGVSKMNTGIINEAALLVWKLRFMRIFGKI
ncbi:polyprenol monophosphomannose synthase [candidate division KSB1 bacterium]|nr:MAG: polyprenol monophosphomannose synthase [candidate division KSB1 bacterium]